MNYSIEQLKTQCKLTKFNSVSKIINSGVNLDHDMKISNNDSYLLFLIFINGLNNEYVK